MAHSLSAKKRVRQNARRQVRNRIIKSRIRTARRAFAKALEAKNLEAARAGLRTCQKLLQRAAANGPVHRSQASRAIGRMQMHLNALEKAGATQ
jgi:small subunit ribosomal protein S20